MKTIFYKKDKVKALLRKKRITALDLDKDR
jgi:hypothetical protein